MHESTVDNQPDYWLAEKSIKVIFLLSLATLFVVFWSPVARVHRGRCDMIEHRFRPAAFPLFRKDHRGKFYLLNPVQKDVKYLRTNEKVMENGNEVKSAKQLSKF